MQASLASRLLRGTHFRLTKQGGDARAMSSAAQNMGYSTRTLALCTAGGIIAGMGMGGYGGWTLVRTCQCIVPTKQQQICVSDAISCQALYWKGRKYAESLAGRMGRNVGQDDVKHALEDQRIKASFRRRARAEGSNRTPNPQLRRFLMCRRALAQAKSRRYLQRCQSSKLPCGS